MKSQESKAIRIQIENSEPNSVLKSAPSLALNSLNIGADFGADFGTDFGADLKAEFNAELNYSAQTSTVRALSNLKPRMGLARQLVVSANRCEDNG